MQAKNEIIYLLFSKKLSTSDLGTWSSTHRFLAIFLNYKIVSPLFGQYILLQLS